MRAVSHAVVSRMASSLASPVVLWKAEASGASMHHVINRDHQQIKKPVELDAQIVDANPRLPDSLNRRTFGQPDHCRQCRVLVAKGGVKCGFSIRPPRQRFPPSSLCVAHSG